MTEYMPLMLAGVFLAGVIFALGMLRIFAFCESLLEKENREQEEKMAQEGGNCF